MLFFQHSIGAAVGQPMFGNQWLALLAMLGLIAVFMAGVWALGRILAASHPDETKPDATGHIPANDHPDIAIKAPSPEILAVISAAVVATYGPRTQIMGVQTLHAPSADALMLQWALEGRRQIYTSHNVR